MGDTKTEFVDAVKLILGIKDNDSDELINFYIEDTENAVLSYCRLAALPRQIASFIPTLAAERLCAGKHSGIKSVTEGDRRVEYGGDDYDFLSAYAARLKPFISRDVKVPSDLDDKNSSETLDEGSGEA